MRWASMYYRYTIVYYLKGFHLLNKNIDLYFLGLFLSALLLLIGMIDFRILRSLLSLVVWPYEIAYSLSIPYWLALRQRGKTTDFRLLRQILQRYVKRIILPLIGLFAISWALVMAFMLGAAIFLMRGPVIRVPLIIPIITVIGVLFSASLIFTPVFFSLENHGLIKSALRSIGFSLLHPVFVLSNFLIGISQALLMVGIMLIFRDKAVVPLLSAIIAQYVGVWLQASTLLFYQDKTKNIDRT